MFLSVFLSSDWFPYGNISFLCWNSGTIRLFPYKHSTCIPRWNDAKTTISTSFQRGIHVVCLQGRLEKYSKKPRYVSMAENSIFIFEAWPIYGQFSHYIETSQIQCIKHGRIQVFLTHISAYKDRILDSLYRKIRVRENPYFGIFYAVINFPVSIRLTGFFIIIAMGLSLKLATSSTKQF